MRRSVGDGEASALSRRWDVDGVGGENALKNVASFVELWLVGDDEHEVVGAAACGADVEAAA